MPKQNSDCRATVRKHPWPMVRLGDVCEFSRGLTYSKSDEVQVSSNVVLRSNNGDLGTGRLVFDELKYIRDSIEIPKSKRVSKGAILMCTANGSKQHLGKVALIDDDYDYAFGGFMGLLTPNDSIDSRYLYWQLMSFEFKRHVTTLTDGTNINNLKFADIAQFTFPLPPLSVQREIVARLERELAAVEKMKKGFEVLAETAKAEFKAERLEAHKKLLCGNWPCEPLKKHVDVLAGYAFKSQGFVDSGIRICGGLIIAPDRIKWEECKYWNSSNGIEQYLLQENDLVIALDRPWISGGFKIGVIGKRDLPCLLIQRTARLRMKDVDFRYVMMLLRDESFKLHCTTSGTTVPHISHKDIETYEIPFPPAKVQKEIVARLSAAKTRAEKLEAKAREGVAVCETMRKAILKEAFDDGRASPAIGKVAGR